MRTIEGQAHYGWKLLALAVAVSWTAPMAWPQRRPAPSEPPSVAWKEVLTGKPTDYVKSVHECQHCHRAETLEFEKTAHAEIKLPTGHPVATCAICHGPDKAHADAEEAAGDNEAKQQAAAKLIFAFRSNPKENAERCLACHITSSQQENFAHSQHAFAGVTCNDCHSAHLVEAIEHPNRKLIQTAQEQFFDVPRLPIQNQWLLDGQLRKPQPDLCYTCHATIEAQFALPMHHRVPEGLMKCTDCHNPHGTNNQAMLRAANWETCVKCHVEKRGPFVYEHPVARVEGCITCHNPHGSVNNFMLARREGRLLCLQCHTGFHTQAGVPHGRLGFQTSGECVRCHVEIHGSNFDPNFLR
jgi:predicted CXXCH cytochrome family protein